MRAVALLVALAVLAGAAEGGEGASRAAVGAVMGLLGVGWGEEVRAPLTAPSLLTARLAAASSPNGTQPGPREAEARQGEAVSGPDYEEEEDDEEALPVHQYIVDDLIRGEAAVPGGMPRLLGVSPSCLVVYGVLLLGAVELEIGCQVWELSGSEVRGCESCRLAQHLLCCLPHLSHGKAVME